MYKSAIKSAKAFSDFEAKCLNSRRFLKENRRSSQEMKQLEFLIYFFVNFFGYIINFQKLFIFRFCLFFYFIFNFVYYY
jgi:hypothetical protein